MNKNISYLIWNYLSVVIMAICGLVMTSSIALFYDASVLGIFNESYAWYVILSQLSVCGVHMSVLKYVPEREMIEEKGEIVKSSLIITAIISFIVLLVTEGTLLHLYNIPWKRSMQIAFLGIPFFSFNKVLLNYLNAIYELVAFAVFQSMRYLILTGIIIGVALAHIDHNFLAYAFPVSELLVCFGIVMYLLAKKKIKGNINKKWVRDIVLFGLKIFPSNMVTEMNSKIDVVCLGFLVKDTAQIGVYSFAILFTEGFYMLYFTIRKLVNPKISQFRAWGNLKEYICTVNNLMNKYLVPGSVLVYFLVLFIYFIICCLFKTSEYGMGLIYIAIICLSIAINGKSIVWGDYLSQSGFPAEESKVNMQTVISNIAFNILLIICLGTVGAAVGTAASYFVYTLAQKRYTYNRTGERL